MTKCLIPTLLSSGFGFIHGSAPEWFTRRRGGRKFVDDTVKTLLERCAAEVDEQANQQIYEAKMGQQLFAIDGCEFLNGLEFHDDALFHLQTPAL